MGGLVQWCGHDVIEVGPATLASAVSRILCLGAHADDIEIGCGGFLLRLLRINPAIEVTWVVLTARDNRATEARLSAERILKGITSVDILIREFREGYFPYIGAEVKEMFDSLGREYSPDLVFTHHRHDLHQDHRLVSELTWNTFRDHLILEYEIPKFDGDLMSPNIFVQLDGATCRQKIDHLLEVFPSQNSKPWFTQETFWATLRLRGVECRSRTGFAEGFFCRKLVLV